MDDHTSRTHMHILAIEPGGWPGHKKLNAFFLRALGTIGHVTLLAPDGRLEDCDVDSRIGIPISSLEHKSKAGTLWSAMRVLRFIRKRTNLDNYSAIVFLAYETAPLALCWREERKVYLFEHNNIDAVIGSSAKLAIYRHLPAGATHLVFQPHIARYIGDTFGRRAVCVPHPYYRKDVDEAGICTGATAPTSAPSTRPVTIFSPSGSTAQPVQDELRSFVAAMDGAFYAMCKGPCSEQSTHWTVLPFFSNYEDLMRTSDMVFLGARFSYRVSGVAYEALSYGKPVLLLDSLFARELQREYPHMVFPIASVSDIPRVQIDVENLEQDHGRFLREHSFDSACRRLAVALADTEAEDDGY